MEMNLAPQTADATLFDGEAGAYYAWTSPALEEGKLGAGKLVLRRGGFALPHHADSAKIGYVIQGTCTVGIISPNSPKEKVLIINKDDAVPVPLGTISWWYNTEDTETIIIFLGETNLSYNPGNINYYFLAGPLSFLQGFSSQFISKIYNISEQQSQKLAKSQTSPLLVKLDHRIDDINPNCEKEDYVFNLNGINDEITADNLPLLEKVGLSAHLVRLEPNGVFSPSYSMDGSYQVIYVTKGSGQIQIVGLNGKLVLDAKVEEDQLFVVPKFFAMAQIADQQGMEFFSVTTSCRPVFGQLTGNLSPWNALSSSVLQTALNVDSEFANFFKSQI